MTEQERERFFAEADLAYKRLREDPEAWQQELEERAEWDATLLDGIDLDETLDDFLGPNRDAEPRISPRESGSVLPELR
jgi:hypothetical protein